MAGYDPDKYLQMHEDAEGDTWQEKVNSMRREQYAENRERINEQKRAAYAARKTTLTESSKNGIFIGGGISGALDRYGKQAEEHAERYYEEVRHMTTDVKHIAKNTGFSEEEIQGIKTMYSSILMNLRTEKYGGSMLATKWQSHGNDSLKENTFNRTI